MSRREGRESDAKRNRSMFDREPSPKRSRRDGKPASEVATGNSNLNIEQKTDHGHRHHRRPQDVPVESLSTPASKTDGGTVTKESEKKTDGSREGTKHSSNPTEVPRSRSYFQHDERGNAGQVGRSSDRRATGERGWWKDSKESQIDKSIDKAGAAQRKDEKSQGKRGDDSIWRHDGFFEMEADQLPPARKRPPFREKKISVDSGNPEKATETKKLRDRHFPEDVRERRDERGRHSHQLEKVDKEVAADRTLNRREQQRTRNPVREKYGGGSGNYRGRDRFDVTERYHSSSSGIRVEKWKHDLFEEANRSPTPKNEEDQVAKVEALLAS